MAQPLLGFLAFAVGTVVVLTVPVLAVWLLVQLVRGLTHVVGGSVRFAGMGARHVGRFVRGEVVDSLHFAGSLVTAGVVLPLAAANVLIGRFRAARHYATAVEDELTGALISLYRVGLGHPVRLVGLGALTDGLERRLPDLVAGEPKTGDLPRRPARTAKRRPLQADSPAFEGYDIHEELQAGGSGARLFLASPTADRASALTARGKGAPGRVVIKAFDLGYGSTIPQIVRESQSLEAAKRLGLVLEHELAEDAFHYVMPFVPGDDLDKITRRIHARSGVSGLDPAGMSSVLGYARDLCDQLTRFHSEGLWHKDIKPSNLMVADDRLHVVDFGLVTPLESALTLTTHGTEFFRDPELVRLALAGKRVKDVDGVKFDIYSAGAVLYSMIENSFPAHGSLSSISKSAPEALRWIVRRAMADVDKRYGNANEMARDLDVLVAAGSAYDVRPADLPSVRGDAVPPMTPKARRAAYAPIADEPASADEGDVRRFNAFGMAAEVRGLGRLKESLHTARASRKQQRADAAKAKAKAAADAEAARADRKTIQRGRRRGVLRALLILATFGGITGGFLAHHEQQTRTAWADARAETVTVGGGYAAPSGPVHVSYIGEARQGHSNNAPSSSRQHQDSWSFATSTEMDLRNMGRKARVLLLTDPSDMELMRTKRAAAQRLLELGLDPIGADIAGGARLDEEALELLGRAHYEVAQGASRGQARARLTRFARAEEELDAVIWLTRQESTGHLRTTLALGTTRAESARAQSACSESLSASGSCSSNSQTASPWDCAETDDCDDPCTTRFGTNTRVSH